MRKQTGQCSTRKLTFRTFIKLKEQTTYWHENLKNVLKTK